MFGYRNRAGKSVVLSECFDLCLLPCHHFALFLFSHATKYLALQKRLHVKSILFFHTIIHIVVNLTVERSDSTVLTDPGLGRALLDLAEFSAGPLEEPMVLLMHCK